MAVFGPQREVRRKRKRYGVEQIIGKLREAEERMLSQGVTVKEVNRELGVTDQTSYRWRKEYGGLKVSHVVRQWLGRTGVRTLSIKPRSPWENGYCESFNGKLGDELLDREISYTLRQAQVLVKRWRREYNTSGPTAH